LCWGGRFVRLRAVCRYVLQEGGFSIPASYQRAEKEQRRKVSGETLSIVMSLEGAPQTAAGQRGAAVHRKLGLPYKGRKPPFPQCKGGRVLSGRSSGHPLEELLTLGARVWLTLRWRGFFPGTRRGGLRGATRRLPLLGKAIKGEVFLWLILMVPNERKGRVITAEMAVFGKKVLLEGCPEKSETEERALGTKTISQPQEPFGKKRGNLVKKKPAI